MSLSTLTGCQKNLANIIIVKNLILTIICKKMNLETYKPFNSLESIDKLINDLRFGKITYNSKVLFEIEVIKAIRKIKVQLYFKEQFYHLKLFVKECFANR